MKKLIVLCATVLSLVTGAAFAGDQVSTEVTLEFYEGAGSALGNQLAARMAKSDTMYIGCGVRTSAGTWGEYRWGFCGAEDATGTRVFCRTESPVMLDAINSISDFAFIVFAWEDDGTGNLTCTYVGSSTQSFYLPKL